MNLKPTEIEGLFIVQPHERTDGRGSFVEMWNRAVFQEHGIEFHPDQVNVSLSVAVGSVRGMHWQAAPHGQKKLVRCLEGHVFDVAVDVRPGSSTRGQYLGVELGGGHSRMLYIPEGFAHGWQALEPRSKIEYLAEGFWNQKAEMGHPPADEAIGIRWPKMITAIAKRDQEWPAFIPKG